MENLILGTHDYTDATKNKEIIEHLLEQNKEIDKEKAVLEMKLKKIEAIFTEFKELL